MEYGNKRRLLLEQDHYTLALCAWDIATGLWVLFLPTPVVGRLHTDLRRKLFLLGLFSTGALAWTTALVRIPFTDVVYSSVPFYCLEYYRNQHWSSQRLSAYNGTIAAGICRHGP